MVGGYAVAFHARPRSTKDLDVWVKGTAENLERVARALESFGAPEPVVASARSLGPTEVLFFGAAPLRFDVIRSIDGVEFDDAYAERVDTRLGDVELKVIGREHLLQHELASGRPQDLVDAEALRASARGSGG